MRSYKVEAIILSKKEWGEADLLLTVFSKEKGKLRLLAKGARRITSRKKASLDTFNRIKLQISKSKTIDIVTDTELLDSHLSWKSDLNRVALAYYFAEIVDRLTREDEPYEEIYEILSNSYTTLAKIKELKKNKDDLSKDMLVSLGFWKQEEKMDNPQKVLESLIERKISSVRVGRKMLG